MLLGDIIKQYRIANNLSQRDFAKKCNLSHTYISALEKKIDARSGKTIAPTIDAVKNISTALGISLYDLLQMLDDNQEFTVNTKKNEIDLSNLSKEDIDYLKKQADYLRYKNNNSDKT